MRFPALPAVVVTWRKLALQLSGHREVNSLPNDNVFTRDIFCFPDPYFTLNAGGVEGCGYAEHDIGRGELGPKVCFHHYIVGDLHRSDLCYGGHHFDREFHIRC